MVSYIVDEKALLVEADFHMYLDISSAYPVKNPDGSNAQASIHVQGTTVQFALSMLKQFNEQSDEWISSEVITRNLDTLDIDVDRLQETGDLSEDEYVNIDKFMGEEVVPWREFTIEVKGTLNDTQQEANFTVKAPSFVLLLEAFSILSSNDSVNRTALTFYPVEDEDDDY